MEIQAALDENERAAEADRKAKEETAKRLEVAKARVALNIEFERLRFIQRQMAASEQATIKALEILEQPIVDSKPAEAARLFAVGHSIGATVLNLPGANFNVGMTGIGAAAAPIAVNLTYDAQSYAADEITKAFMLAHPDHPQAAAAIAKIETRQTEWNRLNGANGSNGESGNMASHA